MRIALLVTGKTELRGLPAALVRLFPGHRFEAKDDVPGRPFRSFTSAELPVVPALRCDTAVDKLVARAASLVDPATQDPWDRVVVLDDLELVNQHQPAVVTQTFRAAMVEHLERYGADRRAELASAVRQRVSLHLAAPMIESWLFGDDAALVRLGVSVQPQVKEGDLERFEATDEAYLSAEDTNCPVWCARGRKRGDRPKWLGATQRARHPKGYLQWLLLDGQHPGCTRYDEAGAGAAALADLDWARVLQLKRRFCYLRALVEDLEDTLGQAPAVPAVGWPGLAAPLTSVKTPRASPVLRNL